MRKVLGIFILCLFCACMAVAQLGTGSINGTVTDPNGHLVSGAHVKVTKIDTGLERDVETGSEGQFNVGTLPVGDYRVRIENQGFAVFDQNVTVRVGDSASVIAKLNIAGVEKVVEVEAGSIDTVKTETASEVDRQQIDNLPLNGRRVDQLALLSPGVNRSGTFGLLNYHGMSPAFNNYMIEGNDNNQAYFAEGRGRTRIATNISEDAVQEFQVGQSNFLPEFGRATGGSINSVIRSGSNQLHGDGFWYYRNQDFNATDPLAVNPITLQPIKPDEVRHQFGAALGGPIRANKLFFFLSYDAQLRDFPLLITDSSNVLNNGGAPVAPADMAAFNAGRNFLLTKFPGGAPGNTIPRNFNHHLGLAKVDWNINSANDLSITYNHLTHSALNGIQTALVLGAVGNNGSDDVRLDSLNLRLTTVVNSHQVNEARFQWGRDFEFEFGNAPGPNVAVGGFSFGLATFLPRAALPDERHYQFVDNYSWTIGAHTLKFGVDINHINDLINNPSFFAGAYNYTNAVNLGRDLLNPAGTPNYNSYSQNFGLPGIEFATNELGFFGQDQWKILKNVTVNYGLRYDYQALPGVVAPNPLFPQTQKFRGDKLNFQPRVGMAWDVRGNGQTVIRGGYGLFYAPTSNGIIDNALRQTGINDPTKNTLRTSFQKTDPGAPHFPNVLSALPANPTLALTLLDPKFRRPRAQEVNVGLEQQIFPKTTLSVSYVYNRGDSLPVGIDANLPTPNFTRTFMLPDGSTFTVPFSAGVTKTAGNVNQNINLSRPNPAFGSLNEIQSIGNSWYHGMLVELRSRIIKDSQFHLAYTLSRATDTAGTGFGDGSSPEGPFGGGTQLDQFNILPNRGRSATDQPSRLSLDGVWYPSFGKTGDAWFNPLVRNFSFSGLATLESGRPYSTGISTGNLSFKTPDGTTWSGFGGLLGQGGPSILPIVPRNNVTGRPNYRLDMRVARTFKVTERFGFQVLGEGFNVFNHTNFTGYRTTAFSASGATQTSPTAPIALSTVLNNITGGPDFGTPNQDGGQPDGTGARRFQVGLKLNF